MGKRKHQFKFNSTDFITYVWAKRKPLITVSIIAAIISAVVSLIITPKYLSSVIMFPASSGSISKSLLSANTNAKDDFLKFGSEEESEQLMQVLNSSQIRDKIIQKFNLFKHYQIDTTSSFWRTKLYDEYKGNIAFRRTEFMSVIIDVLDVNPDTAALIANEISNQVDSVMTNIQHERAKKALAIVEQEYNEMVNQMNQLDDSLQRIHELGVINYEKQSEAFNNAYANALAEGKTNSIKVLENKLKILAKYGGADLALTELQEIETERLSALKGKYMEAKVDAEQTIPHKFVVDRAYRAEKKAYPKRMLIVLVSSVSTFFMALLLMIFRDTIANHRKD